jgi:hypothetical protein
MRLWNYTLKAYHDTRTNKYYDRAGKEVHPVVSSPKPETVRRKDAKSSQTTNQPRLFSSL